MNTDGDELQTTIRLAHDAQNGDRRSLEELFERYLPRVRRIVALRLSCRLRSFGQYDDIVQETLLKAFQGFVGFELRSLGEFRNWLAKCAESAILDSGRRQGAQKRGAGKERLFGELAVEPLSSSIFAGREPSPSEVAIGRETEDRIEAALLKLDERHREVIIRRKLCGMTYTEIASWLAFQNEGNARQVCHKALKKLDALMQSKH